MNCPAVTSLMDAYLDSELDTRATQEVREHLAVCPRCAACFHAASQFESELATALRRGNRTDPLWNNIEARVVAVTARTVPKTEPETVAAAPQPHTPRHNAEPWWRFWLWPNPWFYAGLAAVWLFLLVINLSAGRDRAGTIQAAAANSSDTTLTSARQRSLRAELLDSPVAFRPGSHPLSPQSGRRTPQRSTHA